MRDNIKVSLNYGSIAGIISFAFFVVIYLMDKNPLGGWSWISFWVPIVFIVLAIKTQRDQHQEGFISYGQAFYTGFVTTIVYASLFAILIYLFFTFIDATVIERMKAEEYAAVEEGKDMLIKVLGEEGYEKTLQAIEERSVATVAFGEFFNKGIGGLIISLIAAAFIKRNRSIFDETADE